MNAEAQVTQLRRQLRRERRLFIFLLLLLLLIIFALRRGQRVWAIAVDGVEQVYVRDAAVAEQVLAAIRSAAVEHSEIPTQFAQNVRYYPVRYRNQTLSTPQQAQAVLSSLLDVLVRAYAIIIQGQPIVALATESEAREVLDTLMAQYAGRVGVLVEEPTTLETVTIEPRYVYLSDLAETAEEGVARLTEGTEARAEYVVKAGDVASRIAQAYGLTLQELQNLNPGRDLNRLQIGDRLRIQESTPLLTVVTKEAQTVEQTIPFRTKMIPRPSLRPGERQLKRPGRPGRERVKIIVTCHNGREVSREVVAKEVLDPPIPEEIYVSEAEISAADQ